MERQDRYYIVKAEALPEVYQKVAEVNRLIESGSSGSVSEAVKLVGISRSSYYKYKDQILPFSDRVRGSVVTLSLEVSDEPGVLSDILSRVAAEQANIITIYQSVPVSGRANISLTIEAMPEVSDIPQMVDSIAALKRVRRARIVAREQNHG